MIRPSGKESGRASANATLLSICSVVRISSLIYLARPLDEILTFKNKKWHKNVMIMELVRPISDLSFL